MNKPNESFDLQAYLTAGVERLISDALKATLKNPKESAFMGRFALAAGAASKKRKASSDSGKHIPAFLIASITSRCNLNCAGCYSRCNMEDTDLSTDILAYIANDEKDLEDLKRNSKSDGRPDLSGFIDREEEIEERMGSYMESFTTKDIGDIGEGLVHGHECMRVKLGGREDLIHLIKRIPTQFAVGYDISSVELDERKRFIEVKTTISSKPLHFNRIHLTRNEWNMASSTHDRYFVYRLLLSKNERKLFLLQDPVGLYKNDKIEMVPSNGADITFDPAKVGSFEELLTWRI